MVLGGARAPAAPCLCPWCKEPRRRQLNFIFLDEYFTSYYDPPPSWKTDKPKKDKVLYNTINQKYTRELNFGNLTKKLPICTIVTQGGGQVNITKLGGAYG